MGSSRTRHRAIKAVQALLTIAVVGFAVVKLHQQWPAVRHAIGDAHPDWGRIGGASAIVLLVYAVLIQAWRIVLRGWRVALPYPDATRIWIISNLGKYVPGRIWAITTMAVMAQARGVSPAVAAASSLLILLVNTVVGFMLVLLTGAGVLHLGLAARLAIGGVALLVLAMPSLLPHVAAVVGHLFGRDITIPRLPTRTVLAAGVACAVAWLGYGLAFRLFIAGLVGSAPGTMALYVAVFAGAYLLGFIAIFTPSGLGVRETAMAAALAAAGFATGPAFLVVVSSRLWLTVLEVSPAAVLLCIRSPSRRPASSSGTTP